MSTLPCGDCGDAVSVEAEHCPHCGRPRLFPNVRLAEQPDERNALQIRYDMAVSRAAGRGCDAVRQSFEAAVSASRAVLAATVDKLLPIAHGQVDLFATFYDLHRRRVASRPQKPGEPAWDSLRPKVEGCLFGDEGKKEITHAALSLSESSLKSYGECHFVLRESHTAHRLSAFEENSISFFLRNKVQLTNAEAAIRGFRCSWKDRHLLVVAKLEPNLQPTTTSAEFPGILLKDGASGADDEFIELHLFGSMTLKSVEKLTVFRSRSGRPSVTKLKALKERALAAGVVYNEVTL